MQQGSYKSDTNAAAKLAVEQTILNEIAEGNYVVTDTKPVIVSALGAIPKPDSSEVHLIHDSSRPHAWGLNDYIQSQSFKFQTLHDAIKLLQPNYIMAKIDLQHAYRAVPIHCYGSKLAIHRAYSHPTYFYDTQLPFGAKSSPEII